MPNIKAIVEYDGADFSGFQRQPAKVTIQGELERALSNIFRGQTVKVIGAGRTDAGVHATGQVISFQSPERFPADKIRPAMNGNLPKTIVVKAAEIADDDFHARYSAKARTYIYVALNREAPSAILGRDAWHIIRPLDLEPMRETARMFVGKHDFASFGLPDKSGGATIREIYSLGIGQRKDAVLLKIRADSFLRGMMRALVGSLVEVGLGKSSRTDIERIFSMRDRRAAHVSAPPGGLFLTRVEY